MILHATSTGAKPATFRPEVTIAAGRTRVLVEQITAVDPSRLGDVAGRLSTDELVDVDRALLVVLGIDG